MNRYPLLNAIIIVQCPFPDSLTGSCLSFDFTAPKEQVSNPTFCIQLFVFNVSLIATDVSFGFFFFSFLFKEKWRTSLYSLQYRMLRSPEIEMIHYPKHLGKRSNRVFRVCYSNGPHILTKSNKLT